MRELLLRGKRIYLETLTTKVDAKMLQENINDIEQTKYMYTVPYPYTLEDAESYLKYLNSISDDSSIELGIFDNFTEEFIGVVSLENINHNYGNGEIGYWIRKRFWKKGYAKEATQMLIKYAFQELKLIRIYATLQKENTGSLALLTNLGFQVEGLMRKSVKNKGTLVDRYICSLLIEDYKPHLK
ncbi:GNAT family N-acetyltransferase [Clostridium sp. MSJ-4]|uniref:GNAT family N-acetyltransferase n=1 Tax=Clostridium simiarum TaxID=2841506 RepID=A0ABS6F3E6_9CLOT|nr:GNAT family N-acetyltransferase [Clostridium simiarum]MBU5593010.1 GNAT family N-acetyltransferase [Clostridium simiarum]